MHRAGRILQAAMSLYCLCIPEQIGNGRNRYLQSISSCVIMYPLRMKEKERNCEKSACHAEEQSKPEQNRETDNQRDSTPYVRQVVLF